MAKESGYSLDMRRLDFDPKNVKSSSQGTRIAPFGNKKEVLLLLTQKLRAEDMTKHKVHLVPTDIGSSLFIQCSSKHPKVQIPS